MSTIMAAAEAPRPDQDPAGPSQAFAQLAEPFRPELKLHCYRMLGSAGEAEDLVQETYLRAWRGVGGVGGRGAGGAWCHTVCTTRGAAREVQEASMVAGLEVPWLQPFPGPLLATHSGLRDLQGGRVQPDAIAA